MVEHCDVVVVGGGPAGAATAIALARACKSIVVLEVSDYDRDPIGETLPPSAQVPLARLGVWPRFVEQGHTPSPATIFAWGRNDIDENHFICNPYGHGWHLDRRRFDEMLVSFASDSGARVRLGARLTGCVSGGSGVDVEYLRGGTVHTVHAAFMVDATGRASLLARRRGSIRIRFDRLIGIAGMFSATSPESEHDNRTLVEAAADGWWYSAWLPQSRLIVAYMTDADLLPKGLEGVDVYWRLQLERAIHTGARVRGFARCAPLRLVSASSDVLDRVVGPDWLAAGDAAISVDPLSSQGICAALNSGLLAARLIEEHLDGNATALAEMSNRVRERFDRYWQLHLLYYSQEQRWPDSLFWKRRRSGNEIQTRVGSLMWSTDTVAPHR